MRHLLTTSSLSSILGLTAFSLLAGCPDREVSKVTPTQGRVEYKDIPVTVNRDIDILFMVDDSPSMADKQAALVANFPKFINVLNTIEGGLPNVHIGVTSSDLGSKGALDAAPGPGIGSGQGSCNGPGRSGNLLTNGSSAITGNFISDVKDATGARIKNYTGNLTDVFSTLATTGDQGCGFEQSLEAVKRALNNNPANNGFLRPSAYLAVILITDEDDCSISHSTILNPSDVNGLGPLQSFRCTEFGVKCDTPAGAGARDVGPRQNCHPLDNSPYMTNVKDYVTFLKGLKTDPNNVIVAGITGPTTPYEIGRWTVNGTPNAPQLLHSCMYTAVNGDMAVADPAVRIQSFLDGFPNRSTSTTICKDDLTDALIVIGQLLKNVIGSPCIDGTLATPYDCSVSDVQGVGKATQTEQVLAACNASNSNVPCWHIVTDTAQCTTSPGNLSLKIERGGMAPPPDTHVIANCVTVTPTGP
jgi:hypothetical protein